MGHKAAYLFAASLHNQCLQNDMHLSQTTSHKATSLIWIKKCILCTQSSQRLTCLEAAFDIGNPTLSLPSPKMDWVSMKGILAMQSEWPRHYAFCQGWIWKPLLSGKFFWLLFHLQISCCRRSKPLANLLQHLLCFATWFSINFARFGLRAVGQAPPREKNQAEKYA